MKTTTHLKPGEQLELTGLFRSQNEEYTFMNYCGKMSRDVKFLKSRIERVLDSIDPSHQWFPQLSRCADQCITLKDWFSFLSFVGSRNLKEYKDKTLKDFINANKEVDSFKTDVEMRSISELYSMYLGVLRNTTIMTKVYRHVLDRSPKAHKIVDGMMNTLNDIGRRLEKLI